jgi:hypothetical protein
VGGEEQTVQGQWEYIDPDGQVRIVYNWPLVKNLNQFQYIAP